MKLQRTLFALLALAVAGASPVRGADIVIGSTADGSGQLIIEFDTATKVRATYSTTIGDTSLYTIDDPGFEGLEADEPGEIYVLDGGTTVSIEITAVDGKTSMLLNAVNLDMVGESVVIGTEGAVPPNDLHQHGDYQLQLRLLAGQLGEGQISFKLSATGGYTDSPEYTLKVTNGLLNGVEYDSGAEDKDSLKCQAAVAKAVRKFVSSKHQLMSKCLDAVQKYNAKNELAVPPADLADALAAAELLCADQMGVGPIEKTLLGKIRAARQKAFDAIKSKCGSAGSADYTEDNDISAHLGLAECSTEELISGSYGFVTGDLAQFTVRAAEGGRCVGGTDDGAPCPPYLCAGGGTCATSLDRFFGCLVPHIHEH